VSVKKPTKTAKSPKIAAITPVIKDTPESRSAAVVIQKYARGLFARKHVKEARFAAGMTIDLE
jgi:hypothetical protein